MHSPPSRRLPTPRPDPSSPGPSRPATARVVVITGGSSGIGLCTARVFAQRGWRVGLIARGAEGLAAAAARLRCGPGSVACAIADVADPQALEDAASQIERDLGPIGVWINNAGIGVFGKLLDVPEEEFRRVLDVTLLGTVNGTRTALRRMLPRHQGCIVNVASLVAFRGAPLQTAYSAAKFGVRGFTEALRSELIHDRAGVHLALVHPPSTNTPFFSHAGSRMAGAPRPVPPVFQPELVAEAIWLAVIERRREVKVTASNTHLALLSAALPGVMDRVLAWFGVPSQYTSRAEVMARRDPALFDAARNVSAVHGPFGREAFTGSTRMWAERNRWAVGLGLAALFLATRPRRRRTAG